MAWPPKSVSLKVHTKIRIRHIGTMGKCDAPFVQPQWLSLQNSRCQRPYLLLPPEVLEPHCLDASDIHYALCRWMQWWVLAGTFIWLVAVGGGAGTGGASDDATPALLL